MRSGEKENEKRQLELKWAIGKIKQAGYAVLLAKDIAGGDALVEQEVRRKTPQAMLLTMEKEALMWAEIAEEYKVEYFSPFVEVDGRISWFGENYPGNKEVIEATNQWMLQILPKIKRKFSGKVIVHYDGALRQGIDPTGYDFLGSP